MEFFLLFLLFAAAIGWLTLRSQADRAAIRQLHEHVDQLTAFLIALQKERAGQDFRPRDRTPDPAPIAPPPEPALRSTPVAPNAPPPFRPPPPIPTASLTPVLPAAEEIRQPARPPELPDPVPQPPGLSRPSRPRPQFNWEQFVGVKLFAWLGGLALFFAAALGLKYSFEHNLVPPEIRAAGGFLLGIGLLVGGVILKRREYVVTSQSLCATGVVILYAVTFACRSFYHFAFFGPVPTFLLMVLITATAFLVAVRLDGQVVAVLGMLGGFLTPILLSTGEDNPLGLFGYLALLNAGLIAVVRRKRWDYLLLLAAVGTLAMQVGWYVKFFEPAKIFVVQGVFLGMPLLFVGAFVWALKRDWLSPFGETAAALLPLAAFGVSFALFFSGPIAAQPGRLFTIAFGADVLLLLLVALRPRLRPLESTGGAALFLLLSLWTLGKFSREQLYWALGLYFAFALLHTAFPVVLKKLRPETPPAPVWTQFFPAFALLLVLLPILQGVTVPWLFWGVVLAIDALAVLLALLAGAFLGLLAVLILTLVVAGLWLGNAAQQAVQLTETLVVIGGFAGFFFAVGALLWRPFLRAESGVIAGSLEESSSILGLDPRPLIPALSASLPFLLLIMVVAQFKPTNPSAIFALASLLLVLLMGLVRLARMDALLPVGLGSIAVLQLAWQQTSFEPQSALIPLLWHVGFYFAFLGFPLVWWREFSERRWPWIVAAVAGPVQFGLVFLLVRDAYPNPAMGLLPAAFAVPSLLVLARLIQTLPADAPQRLERLAWFGGVVLLFVTLIFPIQFDRQWITLGWALEGAALCWLFRRLPHPGLPSVGVALLLVAFGRLALNPAVLSYHPRTGTPLLNWYLYTYGTVIVCLFAAARWLPVQYRMLETRVPPVLQGLGTVLAFLLVNLQIADYFSSGSTLTFDFSGNFARDMTYTIAWALFAFGLLVIGIRRRAALVRYAGLGLLGVALVKLFLHDLARLNQLYRIGAFAAVAVIAMVASFLYQRFLATDAPADHDPSEEPKNGH